MGKTPSMAHQVICAVDSCFKEGMDKHSLKASGDKKPHMIFGYQHKMNIQETGIDLGKYCKEKFGTKLLSDIKHEHIQDWLDSKAATCTKATISQYRSRIIKLEETVKNKYKNANFNWKSKDIKQPESYKHDDKIRTKAFEKKDYEKLMDHINDPKNKVHTQATKAIFISYNYGIRVGGADNIKAGDIDMKNMKFVVTEKGGRKRTLDIKPQHKKDFEKLIEGKKEKDYVIDIKKDSIIKGVRRLIVAAGLGEKYPGHSGGIHSMRKAFATRLFHELIENCKSERDALDIVSKILGHGKRRDKMLIDSYVYKEAKKKS
ncbi:MAG TPA: hypothetical protein DCG38_01810 [Eubacteriaceae bacterium]|nr:hypothetical protein [Eubacteriaceae bacterium]